jgi:hypothetical protein
VRERVDREARRRCARDSVQVSFCYDGFARRAHLFGRKISS